MIMKIGGGLLTSSFMWRLSLNLAKQTRFTKYSPQFLKTGGLLTSSLFCFTLCKKSLIKCAGTSYYDEETEKN